MKKRARKLNLAAETIRTLQSEHLAAIAGGQKPQEPWSTTTNNCTHDLFCPSRMCTL